ncbi:SpoIIE family protein phosphatase [Pseudonocardia sp. N23]|uniref:ATP-binding SpoIIE family protein phosphatase n=1 Tax=Pseudonocardia sp. N23 TaxID=1987376 RepID=UPI000BFBCF9D|nr:SpoIIE family protein phosphatase [Pseudonocardia sp. N23]GAY08017.1 serine phosphatase RsbU, regulator of sigma subunit [Pseudonocardia sp. N23]
MHPADTYGKRLRRLQALTDADLARLGVDELLDVVLERVRDLLSVDTGAVLLLDPSGAYLVATATLGLEEETRQGVRIPVGRGFAGRIAQERSPVTIDEVDHGNVLNPILREKGIRSLLGVPLCVGEDLIGVLHVGTLAPRVFTDDDAELLQLAADRIAPATRARMTVAEKTAASALQRSLLPGLLPDIPGLEFAARYVPGGGGDVGGDWYDVFDLPSGRLCVVVGDVVGRGLPASVAMGRLRSAVRAYALVSDDPAEILRRLDEQVRHFERDVLATVLCAVVEPTQHTVRISSAGHPPPVYAAPGRRSELVDVPTDPPVGLPRPRTRRSVTVDLPVGGGLVLYTDGLVERRHEPLDAGLDRLADAVSPGPAEVVCAAVMGRMIGGELAVDDVALLVVMRTPGPPDGSLRLVEPAVPRSLRVVRHAVRTYLGAAGASPENVADIVLAVGEAAANVVEHAYGPAGGMLEVELDRDGNRLTITVADTGSWRDARGVNRGRGTAMIRELVDEVQVHRHPTGTRVVLTTTIGGERERDR